MSLFAQYGVASDTSTPGNVLASMADSTYTCIRLAVARNFHTPEDVLRKLAKDIPSVRTGVASNPNTPADILRKLAKDRSWFVRRDVASNQSTPVEVLKGRLRTDKNSDVRQAAYRSLYPDVTD